MRLDELPFLTNGDGGTTKMLLGRDGIFYFVRREENNLFTISHTCSRDWDGQGDMFFKHKNIDAASAQCILNHITCGGNDG
ncbi:MAG TPA: hypothetical protein VKT73_15260 [Xanthobacteraceae bacterium]|nr:hypothetical protein [Xanthobacteraceae bacterium]